MNNFFLFSLEEMNQKNKNLEEVIQAFLLYLVAFLLYLVAFFFA